MNLIKPTLCLLLTLISIQAYGQYTNVINSNRPGVSRSAFSVGTNVVQFEVGPYLSREKRTPAVAYDANGFGVDFAARYGLLLEQLEINIEGTYQNDTKTLYASGFSSEEKRSNFKTLTLGAKYLVYDPYKNPENRKPDLYSWRANHSFKWRSLIPAVAVYLGAHYDTKDNPYLAPDVEGFSPKIMVATQHNFPGGWVFVMNFSKDRIGTDQSDFQYILTLTHSFNPQWVIFAETQGIKSDVYADNLFRLGGAYLLNKDLQLDTAITFNAKDTPSVFGANLGVSYRLDFHKDKEVKREKIDNGNSAKEEGKRKSRRNKKNQTDLPGKTKKRKRNDIDFDDN
ncbi:transporter [Flavivirga eckloniae]|uniref:Transporter n=1 Tax=Flavivirga eckloniae TaxID=1803846 RepID=A0A2K9PKT0_9FLAO|nr:transporter [Flavivirga eckloniae]AUP77197.1 transporter [Flavivirga eckloniae]